MFALLKRGTEQKRETEHLRSRQPIRKTDLHKLSTVQNFAFLAASMGVCGGLLVHELFYRLPLIQPDCHIVSLQHVGRAFVPIPALLHPQSVLAGLEMSPLMMGVCQVCET